MQELQKLQCLLWLQTGNCWPRHTEVIKLLSTLFLIIQTRGLHMFHLETAPWSPPVIVGLVQEQTDVQPDLFSTVNKDHHTQTEDKVYDR